MVARFRRYIDNVGMPHFLGNAALLAFLVYLHANTAASSASGRAFVLVFVLPLAIAGLFGPMLMLGFLVKHAGASMRFASMITYVIVGWIVLRMILKVQMPVYVFPAVIFLVFLSFGLTFWVISDRRVFTEKGSQRVVERAIRKVPGDGQHRLTEE